MLKIIEFVGTLIQVAIINALAILMYAQYSECMNLVCAGLQH